jgi:uncharacterized protein
MTTPERKFKLSVWLRLFAVTILLVYAGIIILSTATMMTMLTIPLRFPLGGQSPSDFGAEYEDVTFRTASGLTLSGWYIPSKNGAGVILMHGYHADRRMPLPVAKILARHGYGVLIYDQRATGKSEGDMRSFGWQDISDVDQAVAFLQSRPEIDKNRIGIYGCSIGAGIAVIAATKNPSIAAVAGDAINSLTFEGARIGTGVSHWFITMPIFALYFPVMSLRTGTLPPISTTEAAQRIAPRPLLLISVGEDAERTRAQELYALAGEPKEHHNIPGAAHCGAPYSHPAEYEQYLVPFFDIALLEQ